VITPHPYYRLNPARAVYVTGVIDHDLVSKITPEILRLESESREPITVFIDSPGGSVLSMETILRLLRLSDQNGSDPCHIITAVTTRAASAAADLLSSGDYAIAYPTASILYHGMRRHADAPLTVEYTSLLGYILRLSNDRYALELAAKTENRFSFRFMLARGEFAAIRTAAAKPDLSDLECFVQFIDDKLSSEAKKVWARARERHARYRKLYDTILQKVKTDGGTRAHIEADSIKAIVDFELDANKDDESWSFTHGGIESLAEDFFLLNEYLSPAGHERLGKWALSFGRYILPKEEMEKIKQIENEDERGDRLAEKVRPILEPLSSFFVAFCHALQRGENELTAYDAYWLGLVDEVVGDPSLLSLRAFQEYSPDPEPKPPEVAAEPPSAE
jgi:ATP-dependent protease ClpP protease subunit